MENAVTKQVLQKRLLKVRLGELIKLEYHNQLTDTERKEMNSIADQLSIAEVFVIQIQTAQGMN